MDALLLALLLGLALDQGDRSQHLAAMLGAAAGTGARRTAAPWLVGLVVLLAASLAAALGQMAAPWLRGPAGLLFFAITLMAGAAGMLLPARPWRGEDAAKRGNWHLLVEMAGRRLGDSASLLVMGVAGMTGAGWLAALGGALGGLAALLPPMLFGPAYGRIMPLRIIRPALGALLLLTGIGCALHALGLLG